MERMQLVEKNPIFEGVEFEYIFVDDGSVDNTYYTQLEIQKKHPNKVRVVKLTRNFGSYNSFLAGMYYATGDCNVYLHADLQDPPELIPQLYENYLKGFPLVIANRKEREDPNFFSVLYHYLVKKYAIKNVPKGGFDLILFNKEIKQHIIDISEKNTNNVYLITWLGYPYASIPYIREKRKHGKSQWSFLKKVKLFVDTFYSFTNLPLWIVRFMFLISVLIFVSLILIKFIYGIKVDFQIFLMSFVSTLFLMGIMIVVEYLIRIHETVRKRPNFVVEKLIIEK